MATSLMSLLRRIGRRDPASDLTAEIEEHRALMQTDLEARGLSPREAELESRRLMGNITLAAEDARDVWVVRWLDRLWRDATVAARRLRHERTFTVSAALILALGVATTTSVFSVADAELWRPLPYSSPDQLVGMYSIPADNATSSPISGVELRDWRASLHSFSAITMTGRTSRQVLQGAIAESILTSDVAANYFSALGRPALAGRIFNDADAYGARVALLSDRAWRRFFAADPAIVGGSIVLDGASFTIVGVIRADDMMGSSPSVFLPIDEAAPRFLDANQPLGYTLIARLRPGIGLLEAQAEWQTRLTLREDRKSHRAVVQTLDEFSGGHNWRALYFFLGASLLVLLLSAVNVASLFLSRSMGRQREFAIRNALGGGRSALARQLIVEGAMVALPAGAVGVLFATWSVRGFAAALPADFLARGADIPVDLRACAYAFVTTVAAAMAFALAPLPLARRIDIVSALRGGTRAGRSGAEGRARGALVIVQLALTLLLIAGAGVFLKSFLALRQVPLGFEPHDLISVRTSLSGPRFESDTAIRAYAAGLLDAARAVPGARDVAIASSSPLASGPPALFARADLPRPAPGQEMRAIIRNATPGYFHTLGIELERGREFTETDVAGAPIVAVVNKTMATRMFAGEDPIGRVIDLLPGARMAWIRKPGQLRIIGVAANVKQVELNEVEFSDVYVPFAQMPSARFELIVRASTPAAGLIDTLRERAAKVDPTVPVTGVSTFDARVTEALRGNRFNLLLVSWFAGLAILLAAAAVYGAVAHHVQARTPEFGVRLALGAQPLGLVTDSMWRTARVAAVGGLIGLGATFALTALIGNALYTVQGSHSGVLYGVTTTDPAILTSAFAGLIVLALIAGAVPARLVTRIDPVRALRSE